MVRILMWYQRWSRSLSDPLLQQMGDLRSAFCLCQSSEMQGVPGRQIQTPYVGHLEPNRTDFNKEMNVGPDANLKFPSGRQWNGLASQYCTQPRNVPDGDRTAILSGPSSRSHAIG
ncbi:hypothetical protein F5J12DRAFT_51529 [Pisolithus orientalis]|uniref:uncharacterized protein n=1 Tax=Pisolithus orientalis TaxID=936130 RepID=UPI0022255BB3|nr:uncharacterized protein F5J12DRAFT_51529 [Pisolithus orientalis]KAI6008759.1 hypothetical protein F5J12DRAFT_51529 [Pisolithus orientalis]